MRAAQNYVILAACFFVYKAPEHPQHGPSCRRCRHQNGPPVSYNKILRLKAKLKCTYCNYNAGPERNTQVQGLNDPQKCL